jgi:hypothetical protein
MKKLLLILAFTIGLWCIEACCDCRKPQYTEYSALSTEAFINYGENKLLIELTADLIRYVVDASPARPISFCTAAYGCECDGVPLGLKYPLDSISVTADRDFAAGFPAGTSLKPYFKMTTTNFRYKPEKLTQPLDSTTVFPLDSVPELRYFDELEPLNLFLVKQPDTMPIEGFSFIITCHKSNGAIVRSVIPATRW